MPRPSKRKSPEGPASIGRYGMNHWTSTHSVCDDCPTSRKFLARVLTTVTVMVLVGFGVWILWHSPALVRLGGEWAQVYSSCVDSRAASATLGDFFSSRALCAQWATRVVEPVPLSNCSLCALSPLATLETVQLLLEVRCQAPKTNALGMFE